MRIKNILLNIDDVLYDSTHQMSMARLNALKAMIETGLPADIETSYMVLEEIVKEHGQYYSRHFDELLKRLGLKWDPKIIAAGVIAYRETSVAYLKPYPDTIPSLLKLRDHGYKLCVVADGKSVKQWQKLVQLGVQHFFYSVIISDMYDRDKLDSSIFESVLKTIDGEPRDTVFIGNRLDDIRHANEAGLISIRIAKNQDRIISPKDFGITSDYKIEKLSDLITIIE